MTRPLFAILALLTVATPLLARESLGVFGQWGAFRDPAAPRCYAIAKAMPGRTAREYEPYATVGTWPRRKIRGQVHFRLAREIMSDRPVRLLVGGTGFALTGGGGDAWAQDKAMDAAIVAAMRAASRMTITASDRRGRRFTSQYDLSGAATAMDAATLACARQ